MPPLRDRREDIPVLLNHFLHDFAETYQIAVPEDVTGGERVPAATTGRATSASCGTSPSGWSLRARDGKHHRRRAAGRSHARARTARDGRRCGAVASPANSQMLFDRMFSERRVVLVGGLRAVHGARPHPRTTFASVVRLGLEHTRGNYKMLVQCFNMPPEDYKKFLNFLAKYQCHVPFQRFRMMPASLDRSSHIATA